MPNELFFGRLQETANLQKRYQAFLDGYRQNIAFLGAARIGKTSLIRAFIDQVQDSSCIVYYLDASFNLYSELLRQFCFLVLNRFLRNEQVAREESEDIEGLIRSAEPFIPETIAKVKMMLSLSEGQHQRAAIAHLISLLETFLKETNNKYKLLIVLDEFHQFKSTSGNDIYQFLARCIISQKNAMFIVLSSAVKEAEKILNSDLNLIFGNFERMYLRELPLDEAKAVLESICGNLPLESIDKKFILHITAGHPFYLKLIGKELRRLLGSNPGAELLPGKHYIRETLANLLFQEEGFLNELFREQIGQVWKLKHHANLLKTMYLLADGYQRLSEMKIFIKNAHYIKHYLNRLTEIGIALQSGHIFRIKDRLFLIWLNSVFRPLRIYSSVAVSLRREVFLRKIDQEYDALKDSIAKENVVRIIDLFSSFKGDTVYAENRKAMRLPHLERVRLLRMSGEWSHRSFIIGEGNDVLIAALKDAAVEDSDVIDFKTQCVSLNASKVVKCIVTLDRYSDNARLAAKENNITLWNKDDVNFLLRLYNKPIIV